jgi:hypothetical protein
MIYLFYLQCLITAASAAVAGLARVTPVARWFPAASGDVGSPYFIGFEPAINSAQSLTC